MPITQFEGKALVFNNGVVDVQQNGVSVVDENKVAHITTSSEGNVEIDNLTIIKNAEQELEVPFDNDTIYRDPDDGFIKARGGGSDIPKPPRGTEINYLTGFSRGFDYYEIIPAQTVSLDNNIGQLEYTNDYSYIYNFIDNGTFTVGETSFWVSVEGNDIYLTLNETSPVGFDDGALGAYCFCNEDVGLAISAENGQVEYKDHSEITLDRAVELRMPAEASMGWSSTVVSGISPIYVTHDFGENVGLSYNSDHFNNNDGQLTLERPVPYYDPTSDANKVLTVAKEEFTPASPAPNTVIVPEQQVTFNGYEADLENVDLSDFGDSYFDGDHREVFNISIEASGSVFGFTTAFNGYELSDDLGTPFRLSSDGHLYYEKEELQNYSGLLKITFNELVPYESYKPGWQSALPSFDPSADEGKVLKIVNGVPTWVTP